VSLVQIDLRRGRDRRPDHPAPASATVGTATPAVRTARAPAWPALAPAVGMILLAPLAGSALHSGSTLGLLLVGLGVLGLTAALLGPASEVDPS
jgi:hypothetical protein